MRNMYYVSKLITNSIMKYTEIDACLFSLCVNIGVKYDYMDQWIVLLFLTTEHFYILIIKLS